MRKRVQDPPVEQPGPSEVTGRHTSHSDSVVEPLVKAVSPGILAAHRKRAELKAAGVAVVRLTPTERAAKNPKSCRLAIKAKCWECSGADSDPGVRARVRDCSVVKCPLYPVRPWQLTKGRTGYTDGDPAEPEGEEEDGGDEEDGSDPEGEEEDPT